MAKIRHRLSKPGWLRVLLLVLILLGFGLTTAGPGGAAQAARSSGRGGSGMRSGGASDHHGGPAMRSAGGRSGSFRSGIGMSSRRSGLSVSRRSTGGLRTGSSGTSNSLHMRGLLGIGRMDYRPLTTRTLIGPRPVHEPQPQSHVAGPLISGSPSLRLRRGGEPQLSGFGRSDRRDLSFGQFRQTRSFGGFDRDHDRFFDFGRFDHFRDYYRFDRDDFARFHRYGSFRFRCPTIVPYQTFVFPDEFLFGDWFGINSCWWWGHVAPSGGVTVVLVF